MIKINAETRLYLNFWWEYLAHRYTFYSKHKLSYESEEFYIPREHYIWPTFSFKQKEKVRAIHVESEESYLRAFSGWFLREISSDSLCPENKLKLFIAEESLNRIFITDEELEGNEFSEVILKEQREKIKKYFNYIVKND